jgi:uncharacterized membrane protein (UPF0127 family)
MPNTKLIYNAADGQRVCVGILADRPLRRMRGLMGRRSLSPGEGLLLTPAPAIHTAFMRFSIDALFLDRELRVLGIAERLRPWRVAGEKHARSVLELRAGECQRLHVSVGDTLELREGTVSEVAPARAAATELAVESPPRLTVVAPSNATDGEPADEASRFASLRVLVVSADRRFRGVMSLLLTRRGCAVTTTANPRRLAELLSHATAGGTVVVLDTAHTGAAAALAELRASASSPGVVLVADDPHRNLYEERMAAKWDSFADLLAAIDDAGADLARIHATG